MERLKRKKYSGAKNSFKKRKSFPFFITHLSCLAISILGFWSCGERGWFLFLACLNAEAPVDIKFLSNQIKCETELELPVQTQTGHSHPCYISNRNEKRKGKPSVGRNLSLRCSGLRPTAVQGKSRKKGMTGFPRGRQPV